MVEFNKYLELPSLTKKNLDHFIQEEFGHIPFVSETQWSTPDWTILIIEDNEILTFLNIVIREVNIDLKKVKVAGINNLITPKNHRGNGYASKIMNEAQDFIFKQLGIEHAILLCASSVMPFYNNIGWYKVNSDVYFEQPSGLKLYNSNTMLLSDKSPISPQKINLNGLPW